MDAKTMREFDKSCLKPIKELTPGELAELEVLEAMPEEDINFTDIPEITDWSGFEVGRFENIDEKTTNDIDVHSHESRAAVTKMVMKLFDLWQISIADQAILLKRSLRTLRRYQKGGCYADDEDMLDRVGYLLSIHKYLRSLYPYNRDLVYRWVSAQNKAFDGQTPIEVMKKGVDGIKKVRSYLGHQMYG